MTSAEKKLSIIVPVYQNAESLWELYERISVLEPIFLERHMTVELIFIDDGSRDHSYEILCAIRQKRPQTKLIRFTRNFGEVAAATVGFSHATGDCITSIAADLQNPPEQLPSMIDAWEKGAKLVFACRRTRNDPWLTRVLAGIYYKLLDMMVTKGLPSGGVDAIFFDKSLLPYLEGLGRGVNYSLYLFLLGFETAFVPYDREGRKHGKSQWTLKKKFVYFLDTITGFSVTPFRIIAGIGVLLALINLVFGLKLLIAGDVATVSLITVFISFGIFIITAMLAIIGEYLWRIFEVISLLPKSVIAQKQLGTEP